MYIIWSAVYGVLEYGELGYGVQACGVLKVESGVLLIELIIVLISDVRCPKSHVQNK